MHDPDPCSTLPNTVARLRRQPRVYVADETESVVKDASQLVFTRPVERGFVVDTHVQAIIWERALEQTASAIVAAGIQ